MGRREEHKKELLERIFNGKPKDFEIKKVELSKDDPILQSAKKMIGGVDPDYVIKQAEDFLNAPADPNFSYKGSKTRTIYKVIESPGRFFGIKLGKVRIGLWVEIERD
ncbi:hypothetical protein [Cytobacillus kochii]|uniref:hypothetical protein n=1 Tax=Cytobacillus kochii TaxID=859143 RepID=UPI0020426462|nr:hypothetical protein [Cytobacillus kochii]MCM3323287.1 hypothetical protein [Cytobacillus kochii]MCM3345682.1 hypothetical protein [Cytobacillus kochii]